MPEKDIAYYLTLFKIEGHTTWRAHLGQKKDSFHYQVQNDKSKVTDMVQMRIDRISGTFQPL